MPQKTHKQSTKAFQLFNLWPQLPESLAPAQKTSSKSFFFFKDLNQNCELVELVESFNSSNTARWMRDVEKKESFTGHCARMTGAGGSCSHAFNWKQNIPAQYCPKILLKILCKSYMDRFFFNQSYSFLFCIIFCGEFHQKKATLFEGKKKITFIGLPLLFSNGLNTTWFLIQLLFCLLMVYSGYCGITQASKTLLLLRTNRVCSTNPGNDLPQDARQFP